MSTAQELKNYDPNVRFAMHVVELTYMVWDYKITAKVQIGGNTKGASILNSAIGLCADKLREEQGDVPVLILAKVGADDQEETLECTCDQYVREADTNPDIEWWLERMCVGIRIVDHIEEAKVDHEII